MVTLSQYLDQVPISQSAFARKADLDNNTVRSAIEGKTIRRNTAIVIANTLSDLLHKEVKVQDIEGLSVS